MNIKKIRLQNLRALAKSVGGVSALARKLQRSQSQISHLISSNPIKNIGDRLATEIESVFEKPDGWLDRQHFQTRENSQFLEYAEVPFFNWDEISKIALDLPSLFSIRIEDDSMETANGISFVKGGKIIIDREAPLQNGSYVIVSVGSDNKVMFRKFIKNDSLSLEALNPKYPTINLKTPLVIYGVVRQLIFDL
jgi:hypothetical protein